MSNGQDGVLLSVSEGGVSGRHDQIGTFEFLVAPSTTGEFNRAHLRLIVLACWRVDDIRFAFDSSFVAPEIATELENLVDLREKHKQAGPAPAAVRFPPLSVFGHADPVGSDNYNKALSGRRAAAIYALLISTTDSQLAVHLWQAIAAQESWGTNQRQVMQTQTGLPAGSPDPQLFAAYMRSLCPPQLKLAKEDFLAHGADPGGKGDFQGCSEFNPLLIFSQKKENQFKQDQSSTATRNAANAPNRRVVVLLFHVGSKIDPTKWPCPRASEGIAACVKRFWSDGEARRSTRLPVADRKFEATADTFGCRFYQRITSSSPCESLLQEPIVLARFLGAGHEHSNDVTLIASNNQGKVTHTIPASKAPDGAAGFCVYQFDPRVFPNPVLLKWATPDGDEHLAGPCDPVNLRDVLFESELVVAEPLVEPDTKPRAEIETAGSSAALDDGADADFIEESEWATLRGVPASEPATDPDGVF